MRKLLLHSCCAPCTTYPFEWLKENSFEPTGFFYNPNIFPDEEYGRRKKCLEDYAAIVSLPLVYIENGVRPVAGDCLNCYEARLRAAARYAVKNGFDCFSTTLLISPYQKHDMIRAVGDRIAKEEGTEFLYHDFREGYNRSRELSRKYNLYRQKYCACEVSFNARRVIHEQVAGIA